jgi:hypothetical protein
MSSVSSASSVGSVGSRKSVRKKPTKEAAGNRVVGGGGGVDGGENDDSGSLQQFLSEFGEPESSDKAQGFTQVPPLQPGGQGQRWARATGLSTAVSLINTHSVGLLSDHGVAATEVSKTASPRRIAESEGGGGAGSGDMGGGSVGVELNQNSPPSGAFDDNDGEYNDDDDDDDDGSLSVESFVSYGSARSYSSSISSLSMGSATGSLRSERSANRSIEGSPRGSNNHLARGIRSAEVGDAGRGGTEHVSARSGSSARRYLQNAMQSRPSSEGVPPRGAGCGGAAAPEITVSNGKKI